MQRYLESEHNMKIVIRDVMRYCGKKGIPATEACTRLLIQLTALDVDKNFIVMTKEQCSYAVDDLIDIVIRKLSNELSPALLTIKMQSYFPPKFLKKDKIVFDHRNNIAKVTEPLMRELMEKDIKEKELLDALYHKLVVAVTLLSGLGNPTHRAILCSSSLALSSIFPVNELPRFLTLGRLDKERQIEELTHVVAGIRIFNYDTHKHVEGIDDLPNILREACIASKESLENEISSVKKSIEMICKVLKESYVEEPSPDNPDDITLRLNDKILSRDLIEFFRDLLIAKRQMDVYLGQLVYEVERCNEEVKLNVEMLRNRLTELQELVKYRTAIPTTYIYPLFIQVSVIWCSLQDQMVLLSAYNNMLQNLKSYFHEFDQKTSFLDQALANIEVAEKKKRELKSQCHYSDNEIKEYFIDPDKIQNCRLVYYNERDTDTSDTPQFFGCCALRLIEGNGLLVSGDPTIGLLTFGMTNYCFATCKSAYKFDKKPEMYLKQLLILVRRMPELITLLDMAGEIHRYVYKKELQLDEDESEVYKVNSSTQTVTHPIESYIDPTYSWDIWELKRKAVQLADICKRRTHSTQTRKSHMRMNVGVQTYEPKEKSTQTKRDNKSTMPKPSTFIFGLRGRSDNLAHTAILTRPHDEWLYEPGARILKNNKI